MLYVKLYSEKLNFFQCWVNQFIEVGETKFMQNPSKQLTEWHKSSVSTKLSPDSPSAKENLAKTLDGNVPHPYSIQILKN